MKKLTTKKDIKSLYEEILDRNRKRFGKLRDTISKNISNNYKNNNSTYVTRSNYETVFKVIGHRKNASSLKSGMNYILNKKDQEYSFENEIGEKITRLNLKEELERFNLLKDEDNLKKGLEEEFKTKFITSPKKATYAEALETQKNKEQYLKNRQICHAVFSLPNNYNNKEKFKEVMRDGLKDILIGHKYVFVIEQAQKVHIVIYILKVKMI